MKLAQLYEARVTLGNVTDPKRRAVRAQKWLEIIQNNPSEIQFIEDPTEEMQMAAVTQSPVMIVTIKQPTQRVIDYIISNEQFMKKHPARYRNIVMKYVPNELLRKKWLRRIDMVKKHNEIR